MKKILFFLLFAVTGAYAFSITDGNDYVLTNDYCIFFEKVKQGKGPYVVGVKSNGEKVRFICSKVLRYRKNGEIYERVPVVLNSIKSATYEFMRVVCRRDEMTLYEYKTCSFFNKKKLSYYIFRKNQFVVEVCSYGDAVLISGFDIPEKLF